MDRHGYPEADCMGAVVRDGGRIREIRRFRQGAVRADEDSGRWSVIAAYVAATYRPEPPPRRVRVVEIGAVDGSSAVLFDGTVAEACTRFRASGRSLAAAAADDDHVVPCRSCGDCKAAGCVSRAGPGGWNAGPARQGP